MTDDSFWKISKIEAKYVWLFVNWKTPERFKILCDLVRERPEIRQLLKSEYYMQSEAVPVSIRNPGFKVQKKDKDKNIGEGT